MRSWYRLAVIVSWLASLVAVGALASAQPRRDLGRDPGPIISGSDIGFRPEGWNGKARAGTWLVRIDGQWVEAVSAIKTVAATR